MPKLLTNAASNAKTAKESEGIEAVVLHLAPADLAGVGSVCPWSTAGCRAACLNTSGRSQLSGPLTDDNLGRSPIHRARIRKTRQFMNDRAVFFAELDQELCNLTRRAAKKGKKPVARLNATSDIAWERFRVFSGNRNIFERHPSITFYDYTKSRDRAIMAKMGEWPRNYTLTLSRSEEWEEDEVEHMTSVGINVAVVFGGPELPERYDGAPVIDGTKHDWRFTDPSGVVVGLLPKGRAKHDASGFVVEVTR